MKQTVLQEMIKWTLENAFNVTAEDGTSIIAIDHEEMREQFNLWLLKEKEQLIAFGYNQIQEMESELGDMIYKKVPEEIYKETFGDVV